MLALLGSCQMLYDSKTYEKAKVDEASSDGDAHNKCMHVLGSHKFPSQTQ